MQRSSGLVQPDLKHYRSYVSLLVRLQVNESLEAKLDSSGIVQQTLWELQKAWESLRELDDQARLAWLRTALANNLRDELDRLNAAKRQAFTEHSLEKALEESSARVHHWLAAEQSTPSQLASRREQGVRLAAALEQLPENQRRAVELRHLKGLSLSAVAEALRTSRPAVVGLLHRGLKNLRAELTSLEGD